MTTFPNTWQVIAGALVIGLLAGCGSLPRGAPIEREVLSGADQQGSDFSVYQVTRSFLPAVTEWPTIGPERPGWIGTSRGSSSQVIRVGDVLNIAIWDNSPTSLITAPNQRVAELPAMRVSASGQIFLPYVGPIRVVDATPSTARARMQRAIEDVAPSAQVQLSMQEGRGNSVDLVGGVAQPGSFPLLDQNYTILSLLAAGGGVSQTLDNPQVRLQRGSRSFVTSLAQLYEDPARDTRLHPGDQVIIEEDRRYFLAVGATGTEAQYAFNRDTLSAMDALAITGGVANSRADPKGLLILREYPTSALRAGVRGPQNERVVFAIDLTTADGLFSARNFEVQHQDLVFATESPVTALQTILSLVGSVFGVATVVDN